MMITMTKNKHLYPPFAPAVPLDSPKESDTSTTSTAGPYLQSVEVNPQTGRISVQIVHDGEPQKEEKDDPSESRSSNDKKGSDFFHRLSSVQMSWLIVFLRKWARKAGAGSKKAGAFYRSTIMPLARQSADVIQKESKRAATYVVNKSAKFDEKHQVREKAKASIHLVGEESKRAATFVVNKSMKFDEKHQVREKTMASIHVVGGHVKRASKATVKGVKAASKTTAAALKEVDDKHHIMRKSKNSIKKGGRMIRNAWNGKPLNAKPTPKPTMMKSHHSEMSIRDPASELPDEEHHVSQEDLVLVGVDDGSSKTIPTQPSSE